jgi:hypothetical protein
MQGPDTDAQDQPPPSLQIRLATHGRSIHMGQTQSSGCATGRSALPSRTDIVCRACQVASASENKSTIAGNLYRLTLFAPCLIREVDSMTKILLATVAILAFTAPSFAQQDKTTGQAPPSGASSFYLAQDTATMKCQVVNTQPAAGGNMKVIGAAHPTQASAETALAAEKTCTGKTY